MHSSRFLYSLTMAMSAFAVTQASFVDGYGGVKRGHEVVRRQTGPTGTSRSSTTSTESTTSRPSSTTSTPSSSSRTTPPTSTSTSGPPPSSSTTSPPSSTSSQSSTQPPSESSTSSFSLSSSTVTTTVVTTLPDGRTSSYTSESVSTSTQSLSENTGSGTTGMDEKTRNTIIGVVVGVGGAIILAVIALVCWRVWGRKKSQEEGDGANGFPTVEKTEPTGSTNSRSPFQSTLESYHAPTQVNASSNF